MDERTSSSISAVVAWICIAAYVLALAVAGVQIGFNIRDRQTAAEQEFSGLVSRSSRISAPAFMNEAYRNTIQDALSYSENLQGIILTGPDGEYAFERALSGAINWVGNSPRFAKQFGTSSRELFSPLDIEGLRNVTLSAVYRYIDFDLFLSVLKRTLIVVLAALTIAFFALILESVTDKRHLAETETNSPYLSPSYSSAGEADSGTAAKKTAQKTRRTASPEEDQEQDIDRLFTNDSSREDSSNEDLFNEDSFIGDSFSGDSFNDIFGTDDENALVSGDFPGFDSGAEDTVSFGEDAADTEPVRASPDQAATREPPPAGVGREDDTRERLDAELRRCEVSGQDLTVIALEYGNPDDPDGIWFRDFARMVSDYFDSAGTIFEKGKTGVTAILSDTDINSGIKRVRELRGRIPTTFTQKLAVGLSSRLGRFVKADRILLEAAEASAKSREDPENRIVAFKSDLEKYRAFIEKKSVQ
jgi:hypothetical protein